MFNWQTIHYKSLDSYVQALLPFKKPDWIRGITIHHSLVPTRAMWNGASTMEGTKKYYINKGWTSGPHLFLAALSSNRVNDGIWAGTPLAVPGTHAGICNKDHIGIEVIGNYDKEYWPKEVEDLLFGVVRALMKWGNIPVSMVQGHRECLPNKSCPGSTISMKDVRSKL